MKKPDKEKRRETTVEFLASLAAVLVTSLFIITFIVQPFEIPTGSMENTLLIGDHLFADRVRFSPKTSWISALLPYRQIKRGDVFVFLHPTEPGMDVVKRVIGIPGDRIHLRDGIVYRNGEKLDEPYVIHDPNAGYDPYRDNFPEVSPSNVNGVNPDWALALPQHIQGDDIVVPENNYFGMGDNRDDSLDSRYWGFIPKDNVIGQPLLIWWSFETPRGEWEQKAIGQRLEFFAHVVIHFFDQTRWHRTLRLVR